MYLDIEERAIRKKLIEVAKQKGTITYNGLNLELNLHLDFKMENDRSLIGTMLGNISTFEFQHGRPLLSALVVNYSGAYEGCPSLSFYAFARRIRNIPYHVPNRIIWKNELDKIYAEWSRK